MDGIKMETALTVPFQRLLDCLNEQKELYLRICDVLTSEKNFLIQADVTNLVENNKLKEALLAKSRALEKIRPLRVEELLKALQKEPKNLSISELIPLLSKELARKLIEVQGTLQTVLVNLRSLNDMNNKLVNNARKTIDIGLKALRGDTTESQVYKKQGQLEKGKVPGKIVSKEA
jgi:hypothetical protein